MRAARRETLRKARLLGLRNESAYTAPFCRFRCLFAQLQGGARHSADPAAFARCLSLETGEQQARTHA